MTDHDHEDRRPGRGGRFVVCGEALIDLVPLGAATDSAVGEHFASRWEAQTAGGPLNTAVALARLGRDVDFCGPLSTDAFGRQIAAHLRDCGVGTDRAPVADRPTSLAVLSLDAAGKASYHFHTHATATFDVTPGMLPELADDDWLHIASLVLVVQPGARLLYEWARTHRGPISLDVNVRPSMIADPGEYWQLLQPWLAMVLERGGVIKGSDEDFDFLAAGAQLDSRAELLDRLLAGAGRGCAVTTLGPDGAEALTATGETCRVPGIRREVVDTVGAGDTFTAGFLDVYADRPARLEEALARGVAASAIVVTRRGAQPPTAAEVDALAADAG